VYPGGGVDEDHRDSTFPTLRQEVIHAHEILARSRVSGEFGHPLAAIEFLNGRDDRLALRLRPGEPHGILEIIIGNIYRRFHDSILGI
jgi:hypothetical protein